MYEVNGIELSSSEYNELVMLSEAAERGDNPDEIANARLLDKETNAFNASTVQTYLSLHGHRFGVRPPNLWRFSLHRDNPARVGFRVRLRQTHDRRRSARKVR